MPSKRKSQIPVVPFGMSNKHMKRKKPINADLMKPIEALTENQKELFRCYKNDQNIVAYGCAGQSTEFKWTGEAKSNGWNEVLDRASKQPGANVSKNRYYG